MDVQTATRFRFPGCQESPRHANATMTMELYAQALTPDKGKAQSNLVWMILPKANQLEQRLEAAS
jgi:hypothetical protein